MPYDALGNYIPGDDEPSLDQMRFALTQKQPTYTQIPTGGYPAAPESDRPLDRATRDLKSIATNMNPLMLMKSMREMAGTLAVNPMLMPANAAYELATGKRGTFYSEAQTPMGQAFEEDLGKLMDVTKVPHMWPLTPRPAGARPAITPNDVRVMGAEAARVGRQVRDIPTDFANAQSGVTRLDPVTNAPTLGARIGQAERGVTQAGMRLEKSLDPIVTDIMERGGTSADFLAAMAGQPLYAVRPKGTSLVTPTRIPTATTMSHPYDPVQKLMYDVLAEPQNPTLTPTQLQTAYERVVQPTMSPAVESAFDAYVKQRVQGMFPDAPSANDAEDAFNARFADPDTQQAEHLKFLQDFITQTPEGQQSGLPLPSEIQARHEAAVTWLNGPFTNYVKRNVGTEGDPLVKLASQGLTFLPDATVREMVDEAGYIPELATRRVKAGFPAEGTFESAIMQVNTDLGRVRSEIAELEKRRSVLRDLAQSQGLLDPADMPEYAALTDPIRKKVRERDKLEEERTKLRTGQAYEDLSDLAVVPKQAGDVIQNMDYAQRQFYPTLAMTPPGEKAYLTNHAKMRELGLGDVANAFYDDVLSGAIPLDKVQKTTVENYVRGKAQERVKAEAIAKAKEAEARAQAERNLKAVVQEVPNSMIFGNAAVIELNDRTPVDVATRRVSEDTAILDHCVGEGGTARGDVNNPFTGKRQKYEPIIDLTTGQPNPKASKDSTAYIRSLQSGEQLASIRDVSTGRPVATLQFDKSHLGSQGQQMYRIGYASGVHNGAVDPAYAESIRNYLNSRAGEIANTGDNLADNTGVYDTQSPEEVRAIARKLGVSRDMISTVDFDSLPRFVVAEDVSKALKQVKATTSPAEQTTQGMRETDLLLPATHDAVANAFRAALNSIDPDNTPVANILRGLWQDVQGTYLRDNATIADLRMARMHLANAEDYYSMHGTEAGDVVASTIAEILRPAVADILEQHTPPAEAAAMLMEPDDAHPAGPMPDILGGPDVMGIIDEVVTDTLNDDGLQVGERVETVVHRIAGRINPVSRTQEYIQALRDAADREQSERVELILYDIADRIETQMIQANEPVVAPQPFTRPDIDDMARDLLEDARVDNQRFNQADLQTTLQALETAQFDDARFRALPAEQQEQAQRAVAARLRELMQEANTQPQQQANIAPYIPIAEHAANMTFDQLREALSPAEIGEVAAMHDDIVHNNPNPDEIRQIAQMVYDHQMGPWEDQPDTARAMLYMELTYTANRMEQEPPQRRGPFRPGGSAAVRGMPLGNLNFQPSITAEMLRGPDTQPIRNFIQQVGNLPGVTQEGLRTGLMAFEQMDPTRQMTKAEFVRELLPSSYDIVDLRGASQDNQHLMDTAEAAFDQDASPIGDALGLKGAQLVAWANAVRTHYNDYDSFPTSVKRALVKTGIEDADEYTEAYDIAYRDALETYVAEYAGNLADEDGYTYANTQRLVQTQTGDEYSEFGVTHPDQHGTYHHFDLAPEGVIGHFRGTYNPANPILLNTEHWVPSSQSRTPIKQAFKTKPNSYVIEEIQSDAQKVAQQAGHLHQVHGVLFKAAIQKALELGATTVYLPTARIIADARVEEHYTPNGEYIPLDKAAKRFAPIYDQAIMKEGLKPLLKIPGVTSKMINGYHEISFTPAAIEHILNGPGQSVPGYQDGGSVKAPGLLSASHRAIERSQEMFPRASSQDSAADAARHMLASGYLAKSWNPTVAKAAGWWHEFSDAPTRTLRHNLGLGTPRYDYPMDMHNNQLGIELAKKAKDIPEFERLVQQSILQATPKPEEGRAYVMPAKEAEEAAKNSVRQYANGGTVSRTPSLDSMRLELMMRRK